MLHIRAGREGEFGLHLYTCKQMMPYFFAAGHVNYARYALCYIKTMEKLLIAVLHPFLRGEHVARHQEGIWNAIWVDMLIETTFMRYEKGPTGLIGVTTKPRAVQIQPKSLHFCYTVLKDLDDLREKEEPIKTYFKEESHARIVSDEIDQENLRNFLKTCIHPLDVDSHHDKTSLCNIYTGQHATKAANVNKSVQLGSKQMKELRLICQSVFITQFRKQ